MSTVTQENTDIRLPRVFVQYAPGANGGAAESPTVSTSDLSITVSNHKAQHRSFESDTQFLYIIGCPIIGERIDHEGVWEAVQSGENGPAFLRRLNGEFLLIHLDKPAKRLQVINDRFTSVPFYYATDGGHFVGTIFYKDMWSWLRKRGHLTLNEPAVFEFMWLQRLLGTKTYDTASRFLPAASRLTYDGGETSIAAYWTPSFDKTSLSVEECAAELVGRLATSVKKKTSDSGNTYGLFLSGGTDSRMVLASFERPPVCFTLGIKENNEVRVAREVASIANAKHRFIQLDQDPYSKHLDALVQICGGMYAFDNALFFGLEEQVAPHANVVFHGHGIDYLFQGMYVPSTLIGIAGKHTHFSRLRSLSDDFVTEYLTTIQHRLKGIDLLQFVKPEYRDSMRESLRDSVREVTRNGEPSCNTPYDLWEYMLIHALSRHYSHPNSSSMATCAEQRTATFDNDVFDLYLSLPTKHRLGAKMTRAALKRLDPRLAGVRTGNTNIRPDLGPLGRQMYRLWDASLVSLGLRRRTRFYAPSSERTWPDRGELYNSRPGMRRAALDLCRSEALASLDFLDMDVLSDRVPAWVESSDLYGGKFITFLITIDRFLRQ